MNNVVYGPNNTPWWAYAMPWIGLIVSVVFIVAVGYAYWKLVIKRK